MSASDIHRIMHARSVAILGASDDENKWGGAMLRLLRAHGYDGRIHPIHPRQATVQGLPAWPDIGAVPEPVDVALIALPGPLVQQAVSACAAASVGACLVISSSFAEAGEDGARREAELVATARQAGMRLIGPNCMGLINPHRRFNLCNSTASQYYDYLPTGPIGVASQSGALMGTMIAHAYARGLGLSCAASLGNQADVELCDIFDYMIDDEATRVICLYVEGLKSPARFASLARRARQVGKPVIVTKAGRSDAGAHAVLSHTASLAGSHASFAAACRDLGIMLVNDVLDMLDIAAACASSGTIASGGIAVMTGSGGGGALAMDALADLGLPVARLGDATRAVLARHMPDTHLALPFDVGVLASHGATRDVASAVQQCMQAIMADPDVAAGMYVMTTQPNMESFAEMTHAIGSACGKPFFLVNLAADVGAAASRRIHAAGAIEFHRIDACARTLHALRALGQATQSTDETDPPSTAPALPALPPRSTPGVLSESETKDLLAAAGVPVPPHRLASDEDAAVQAAQEMGFPVVLKIEADGVSHKSDLGGVALNLSGPDAVRQAYAAIRANAQRAGVAAAAWRGCLVQPMVAADAELIVGTRWDAQFGPMVLLGIGGTLVELLQDYRLMTTPLTRERVGARLRELRLFPLLQGYRGRAPADLDAVIDAVMAIGRLAEQLGPRLLELDANPVRVAGDAVWVVDARAVVQ